jgi:phosphate starvation-inducible PhoH-like protein
MARRSAKFAEERTYPPLRPLTDRQAEYIAAVISNQMTIVLGPAGTGKTHIAATMAIDMLRSGQVEKVYLTRPNVPGGRSLGFFPGTLEEKVAPWVVPFTSVMRKRIGDGAFDTAMKAGNIEVVPFEVMRGRTFEDSFVILDEAQNTTVEEMKMFLTRLGNDSKIIVNGDVTQSDLKEKRDCGLKTAIYLAKKHELPIKTIEFQISDIVRSDLCAQWVRAFHEERL